MSEKICFVIAPIGEPGSETRRRSDQVLKHVIRPVLEERNYQAIRADEISEPGLISSQVILRIAEAPLVVADLTGHNPNVFYELAIRHMLRLPLVQISQKGEQIPFDVAGMRTIFLDHTDLDSAADARNEIGRQIDSFETKGSKIETPISAALGVQAMRQSQDPSERTLADVLAGIADLRRAVTAVQYQLSQNNELNSVRRALSKGLPEDEISPYLPGEARVNVRGYFSHPPVGCSATG